MGRIVISQNTSLDGVVEDPTGEEGAAHGGWFARMGPRDREAWAAEALDEARRAAALLLGRRTFAFLAERWSRRTGPLAERLGTIPTHVVSSTLRGSDWGRVTVLGGPAAPAAAALAAGIDGDVVALGSARLVQELMRHGLVDEIRLTVHPVLAGGGRRLFEPPAATTDLELASAGVVGEGLAHLVYRRP